MVRGAGQSILCVCVSRGEGCGGVGDGGRRGGGGLPRRWCRMPGEAYTNVRTRDR